jgi:hypothetical protein
MGKQLRWILAVGCLLVLGLASISAFGRVGPLATLFGKDSVPRCGFAWRVVPAASASRTYNELHTLAALAPDNVWAAGIYGGEEYALTLVEQWDGEEWREQASPSVADFSNHLYAMAAVSAEDIWIVGASHQGTDLWRTLALHWDGRDWAIVPTPSRGRISSLNAVDALAGGDVWAVGEGPVGSAMAGTEALVMRWDGVEWRVVETGIEEQNATLSAVKAIGPDDVWAAGSYSDASGTVLKPLLIHWDGVRWRKVEANSDGAIWGLAAVSAREVWAVGNFGPQTLALRWDGVEWKRVATPNPGDGRGNNVLNAISVLKDEGRGTNEVRAVGSYSEGGKDRALALMWDGVEWRQEHAPTPGNYSDVLRALEAVPGSGGEWWAAGASIADQLGNNLPVVLRYSEPCR